MSSTNDIGATNDKKTLAKYKKDEEAMQKMQLE